MKDVKKVDLKHAAELLSGEIEIRVPKKWLAYAAAALAGLVLLALY